MPINQFITVKTLSIFLVIVTVQITITSLIHTKVYSFLAFEKDYFGKISLHY